MGVSQPTCKQLCLLRIMADLSSLHSALQYACSQEQSELKIGEKQLLSWENQSGYYSGLATILADRTISTDIRWMSITCLKNAIDKYWRPKMAYSVSGTTQSLCVSEDEKQIVRTTLLTCIEEPIDKISAQLSLAVGRIARTDCPNSWPELLPFLTEGVRSQSALHQRCCLLALRDVIKAFASWRVVEHRRLFYEITGSLFQYVLQVWLTHLSSLSQLVALGQSDKVSKSLSLACICLKILQLMLLHGFARFNADTAAAHCVGQFHQILPQLLQLRSQLPANESIQELAEKTTTMLLKSLFKLQCQHPIGYIVFIETTLELIHTTIFTKEYRSHLYKDYLIYGLNLLRAIFTSQDYILPITKAIKDTHIHPPLVTPPPQVYEVNRLRNEFYSGERLVSVIEQLVTEFMILTKEDLDEWENDPELYAAPEDATGNNFMYTKKFSVENAAAAIIHEIPKVTVPIILKLLQSVQGTGPSSDTHSLLVKEAVLNILGLAAFDCYEMFDFEQWFTSHLINELSIMDPRYKIVRRRIVWLLGNWVPVKFDAKLRPLLYRNLIPILHPNEDLVIRLSAAESLRQAIDDISFDTEDLSPFIPDTIQLLLKLLQDVQDSETKLAVMKVFSQLIEQVGIGVRPHIGSLLEQIPSLWSEAEGDNSSLLQCVIITTLTHVVNSLGELSTELHPFLIPIIQYSIDMNSAQHVYLAEDGLQLWFAVISQATQPTMELIQLFGNINSLLGLSSLDDSTHSLEGLLDEGSTSFTDCFDIIDAYAVLCANTAADMFLKHCADTAARACHTYIRSMKKNIDVYSIVTVLDRIMIFYPGQGHKLLEHVLLDLIRCALNKEESRTVIFCLYLGVLARSMLCDAQHFVSLIEVVSNETHTKVNILLGLLLDIWTDKLDNISDARPRKLFGLAAASLLTVDDICVIGRFGSLLDMCVEVLHDITDTSTTGGLTDLLVLKGVDEYSENRPHPSMDSEHRKRVRQLHSLDHLWSVSLPELLARQLETCLTSFGYQMYRSLLTSVDIVIREQCHEFLPPNRASHLLCFDL